MASLTNNKYLQDIDALMEDMIRAERYGAINASLANSYAWGIVRNCQSVLERHKQLNVLRDKEVPVEDPRYATIANWIADLEKRLDRDSELLAWFTDVAINEGVPEQYINTNAADIVSRMCVPRKTTVQELEENAKLLGISLIEAKKFMDLANKEKAELTTSLAPELTTMARQFIERQYTDIVEINAFEARRIASTIERKAIGYAERLAINVLQNRPQTNLLGLTSDWTKTSIGSVEILKEVVKKAGGLAARAQKDIEAGTHRAPETSYDTDHGTTRELA